MDKSWHGPFMITILMLVISCSPNSQVDDYLAQFKIEERTTEQMAFDSLVSTAMDLYVIDSMLMINEFRRSGHLISFWNKYTGQLICRKFPVGKGPGEFLPPLFLEYQNDTLGVYNRTDYRYRTFILDSILNPIKLSESLPFPSYPSWIKRISDSVYLGAQRVSYLIEDQQEQPERFSLLSDSAEVLRSIRISYPSVESNIQLNERLESLVFQGSRYLKPDKSKFAIASVDLGSFEIFDLKEDTVIKTHENQVDGKALVSKYSDNTTRYLKFSDEQVRGYAGMYTTNDYIYLLYAGESVSMSNRKGYRYILVLDWEGSPVAGYALDTPVACFTIDEQNDMLYGISYDYDHLITAQL